MAGQGSGTPIGAMRVVSVERGRQIPPLQGEPGVNSTGWMAALGVTLLMQAWPPSAGQSLPVLAPLITRMRA